MANAMQEWLAAASKRIAYLKEHGPEIVAVYNAGGANHWNATINGRKALSMNVASREQAIEYARQIYAKNVKPGLPNPYLAY